MEKLELYIPKLDDLHFREKMLSDPETMSYNANYDIDSKSYHKNSGCIDFPKPEWAEWYKYWVGTQPRRFYAYIKRNSDGAWLGEVNFHYTPEQDWWDMGIVIYAPYRRNGYSVQALRLLMEHAFENCGVTTLHNDFEIERVAALKSHLAAGFRDCGIVNGIRHVAITRKKYYDENK